MPAAFSRLQLAAALIEYDNDPEDPYAPRRSAQESAIFAHLRRNPAAPPRGTIRQSDYLGISLPSETGSLGGRESVPGTRRSRGSIDALRNPFGPDSNDEEDDGEEGMEVDLTSWGLDAFMPKEKMKRGKGRAPSVAATAPPTTTVRSHHPSTDPEQVLLAPRRAISYSRSMSLGGSVDFLREGGNTQLDFRRRSIASPLDVAGMEINRAAFPRQQSSSTDRIQGAAETSQGVPFPTGSTRATSPGPSESLSGRRGHERRFSMASMNSKMLLEGVKEESRPHSTYEGDEEAAPQQDNPFTLQPPSHTSRFDPKYGAHARNISNASLGTRALLNDDRNSVMTGVGDNFQRERRYSTTLDLLRPKVLVMPSPLQSAGPSKPPGVDNRIRDGFTLSKDGPPLPPGARSSRRMSTLLGVFDDPPPIASNSFTPNPLNDLSYAQRLFRNTLVVEGQSNAFPDDLPRATEDGEQAQFYPEEVPEIEEPPPSPPPPETSVLKRPPGKLYGKSLIDDLESRKAQMRSKQRVFTGDQRPSMMARGELQRGSTFIDPASLGRPTSQFLNRSTSAEGLMRRNSGGVKPLLSFENDKVPKPISTPGRPMNSRSVFGVDTLWEREMVKLREIEAQEKIEEEERRRREEEEERHQTEKKGKKKGKGKNRANVPSLHPSESFVTSHSQVEQRISAEPPVLPAIERASRRPPLPSGVDDDEDESDEDEIGAVSAHQTSEQAWHAGSSDEEDGPRRTTGMGLRYPSGSQNAHLRAGPESDEDLPLVATLNKRRQNPGLRPSQHGPMGGDDEDEEQPLSSLLERAKVKSTSSALDINFDNLSMRGTNSNRANDDEDDDQPLGLRASRLPASFMNGGDDDDDRPLGLHSEHQRRAQNEMFVQQQQQQMMMQAQFPNTMFFNPSVMGSGFFPPPMATPMMAPMNPMMMMQPSMPIPSPPPIHDAAKYGRVDKWRRNVAVEGER